MLRHRSTARAVTAILFLARLQGALAQVAPPSVGSMDFVHGPRAESFLAPEQGVHPPDLSSPAAGAPWLDGRLAAPVGRDGRVRPPSATPAGRAARTAVRSDPAPVASPQDSPSPVAPVAAAGVDQLPPPGGHGGAYVSPVVPITTPGRGVMPMSDLIRAVQGGGGAAPVDPPAPRQAVTSPPTGCVDRGLDTILSPACLGRLSPVPPGMGSPVTSIPLPAMPGSVTAPSAAVPAASAQLPPGPGIGCTVTGTAGSTTFRAVDDEACLRGALGMIPPVGSVSVMLLDDSGNTARATCTVSVPGGRATCSGT